jgi:WD40 repeat protein/quercetin dioxygenase-like cupin family protein
MKKPFQCRILWKHNNGVNALARIGEHAVVSVSADTTLRTCDFSNPDDLRTAAIQRNDGFKTKALAAAQEVNRVVSAFKDGSVIVWTYPTGTTVYRMESYVARATSVATTARGDLIVIGTSDGTVFVWRPAAGGNFMPLGRHDHGQDVSAVAVTPDGRLAVSGSYDGSLCVWHLGQAESSFSLSQEPHAILGVDVSRDGKRAISSSADGTVRVWDLDNRYHIAELRAHDGEVLCVAMTPDSRRAVTGGEDKMVRVWNLEARECVGVLKGHEDAITGVYVTSDGKRVVSGSNDATVRLWELGDHAGTPTAKLIRHRETRSEYYGSGVKVEYLVDKDDGATNLTLGLATFRPNCDLRLLSSVDHVSGIPTEGKNLIIVATANHVLRFRIFDDDGTVVVDTDENRLTTQGLQIEDLRTQLESLWPPHELTSSDKHRVITAVTSIVGHAPPNKGYLEYHTHKVSEMLVVLDGTLQFLVAERPHSLGILDAIQIPPHRTLEDVAGSTVHFSGNLSSDRPATILWALNLAKLDWDFVDESIVRQYSSAFESLPDGVRVPEAVAKFRVNPELLSPGCHLRSYFDSSQRSSGFCAGHIRLEAGSSSPRFQNDYDTFIWVLGGSVECRAGKLIDEASQGQGFFVPAGLSFDLGNSRSQDAEFLWVCSGE